MTIYSQTQIYRDTYRLLLRLHQVMPNMPREMRYTLGRSLNETLVRIETLVFRACAAFGQEKVCCIGEMRQCLVEAELYLRLLSDLRGISEKLYVELCQTFSSLSKQMALWEQKTRDVAQRSAKQ